MDFRILGPLEVDHEGRKLPLGGRQQRALLALLLLHANEVVAVDEIVDALWPESPPPSATKSIHALVSRLRGLLEGAPGARNGAESDNGVLLTRPHGYSLRVAPGELDLHRFDELRNDGQAALAAGEADVAAQTLREALALWRGPPLAELADASFARVEVPRLDEVRLSTLEERIDADLAAGRSEQLVPELESLVARHPLRERLRGQLMLALYRTGRQPDALQAYQDARRLLVSELGIEPTPALQRLERAILVQDESLEPPPVTRPAEPVGHSNAEPPVKTAFARRAGRRFALTGVGALLVAVAAVAAVLVAKRERAPAVHVEANSVAVIDAASNRIERQVAVGARPTYIASDGRTWWVANLDDDSVSRIDPRTGRVVRTIATDASTAGLAVGAGSVWVANSDAGTVSRIDPLYDRIVQTIRIRGTGPAVFGLSAVAVGFGSLWVADSGGTVSRVVDPATRARVETVIVGGGSRAIAVGAGAVWVANAWDDTVSRVDPMNVVTATIPVGHGPSAIAVGAGAVWVANSLDDTVSRIDPGTGAVQETIRVGRRPSGIASGAGAVWVANNGGTISRIDPRTNEVSETIRIGGSPTAVSAFGESVLATVAESAPHLATPGTGGGVARFNVADDFDFVDPALAYLAASWQLEYATCAKLLNYPDRAAPAGSQLVPEVARSLPIVSDSGKRFTFTIRDGYRFSPPSNQRVTAQTFKFTIERSLSPELKRAAVGAQFVGDIAGVKAYREGRADHIVGVVARGPHLTIELTHAAPDFPARIAMPFFCAVPIGTPVAAGGLSAVPSAGPYYVASYTPKQQILVSRNPNYRGPRPHRLEEIVYTLGIAKARTVAQVEAGQADYAADGVPPADASRLAARYGEEGTDGGRQRYFSEPILGVAFLALNTSRPLFADANLRKAANYAIDRPALARQKQHSFYPVGEPTDQYLPPGAPGFKNVRIYPLEGPDLATARRLAGGRHGSAVLYTCNTAPCPQQAQIVRTNLKAIGIDVEVREFPYGVLAAKVSTRGEPFDIVLEGWLSDYADPSNFLNVLLDGGGINSHANSNWAYFNNATYNRKLKFASTLVGPLRYRTYAALDADLARNAAPLVAFANYARRDFFSARIGCQVYQPVYGFDLAAFCLRRRLTPVRQPA